MKTSDQGRAALELEEGVVLRAYRDVAGVWTIGAGLTAASGVVKPVAGMVITREEADTLLAKALATYESDVEIAMAWTEGPTVLRPSQHAFDAGVSFHFNTGAISRASWVALWRRGAARETVRSALCLWSKAGGKMLPALRARREREGAMLFDGVYRTFALDAAHPTLALWRLPLSADEQLTVFNGLRDLGYDPGIGSGRIRRSAVDQFQRDHGLTVDGIIGRATLSTLQRRLDQKSKAKAPAAAMAASLAAGASGVVDQVTMFPQADAALAVASGLWLARHLWTYRDAIAAVVAPTSGALARLLRGH